MRRFERSKGCRRAPASRAAHCRTRVILLEDGLAYDIDVVAGQKTGFFLDQRDNRRRIRAIARWGATCWTAFCYTGGFTVAALAGGARSVLAIDSSADALAQARANVARNGVRRPRAASGAKPTCSPNCASCATAPGPST